MPRSVRAPFPFVPAPDLELYSKAREMWPRLLDDISSAKRRIWLENYIFEDGVVAQAIFERLQPALDRGVEVRLLVDAVGSHRMSTGLIDRLRHQGVKFRMYNRMRLLPILRHGPGNFFSRTHRRIVVIDNDVAWTGGVAFGDRWWPNDDNTHIRDTMLRMGGELVGQMAMSFDALWRGKIHLHRAKYPAGQKQEARVILQQPAQGMHFRRDLYQLMAHGQKRIWLATPYFIPSRKFRRTLRHAIKRGVDVRLLLPGPHRHDHPAVRYAARRYYNRLLLRGVEIYEYQRAFMHRKMVLIDDDWTALGSANLDRLSFILNHELMVAANHRRLNASVAACFARDFDRSKRITLEEWRTRSNWNRVLEWFFGKFDRIF
jgi:cardiolipin synthase A/B